MPFAIEEAAFVSFFAQAVTYGFFASLFAQSTPVILSRHKKNPETRRVNMMLLIVSTMMFLLSTVFVSIALYRYPRAFKPISNVCGPNESQISAQLGDSSTVGYIVGTGAYGIQTVLGDGFMIYRTYAVWGGYLPVCVPAILSFLVSTASGVTFMFISSHSSLWVLVFLWLTLFTNGCCTALIAGRIIWLRHQMAKSGGGSRQSKFGPTVTIIVESGAIYSLSLTAVIALYHYYGLNVQNFALNAMPQVMGIIFSFIIIRVASRVSSESVVSQSDSYAQRTVLTEMFASPRQVQLSRCDESL